MSPSPPEQETKKYPLGADLGEALRNTGLLWLLNRVVFHPRGFALAVGDEDEPGLFLMGDGTEPWEYLSKDIADTFGLDVPSPVDEQSLFEWVTETFAAAARHNGGG